MYLEFIAYQATALTFQFRLAASKAEEDKLYRLKTKLLARQPFHQMPISIKNDKQKPSVDIVTVYECDSLNHFLLETKKCFLENGISASQWIDFIIEIEKEYKIDNVVKVSNASLNSVTKQVIDFNILRHVNVYSNNALLQTCHFFYDSKHIDYKHHLATLFPTYLPKQEEKLEFNKTDYQVLYYKAIQKYYKNLNARQRKLMTVFKAGSIDEVVKLDLTINDLETIKDSERRDLLCWAAICQRYDFLNWLYQHYFLLLFLDSEGNIDPAKKASGMNILQAAIFCRQSTDYVNTLLNSGAGTMLNEQSTFPAPIVIAAKHGFLALFNLLLQVQGVDINIKFKCQSAFQLAIEYNHKNIVELLVLDSRLEEKNLNAGFVVAAECGRFDIVEFLIKVPTLNINYRYGVKNAVLAAAFNKHWDIVDLLLSQPNIDLDVVDGASNNFVMFAAENEHWSYVRSLIMKEAFDINRFNSYWKTLLGILGEKNQVELMKLCMKRNDTDINAAIRKTINALNFVAKAKKWEAFQYLLSFHNLNPNGQSENGETPLQTLCRSGEIKFVQALIQHPRICLINLNVCSEVYDDAITAAARSLHWDIVKLLATQFKFIKEYFASKKRLADVVVQRIIAEMTGWLNNNVIDSCLPLKSIFISKYNFNRFLGVKLDFGVYLCSYAIIFSESNKVELINNIISEMNTNRDFSKIASKSFFKALNHVKVGLQGNTVEDDFEEKYETKSSMQSFTI